MKLKIFDFDNDQYLIDSFLENSAIAHNLSKKKDESWFKWKFEQNPYGKAILACAINNDNIVGCVALGHHELFYYGQIVRCALSYETFVAPAYQGKGLFKKLIGLAEDEAKKRKIQVLINFPNKNSLPGFKKLGWQKREIVEYWLKIGNPFKVLKKIDHLKKPFIPFENNFLSIKRYDGFIEDFSDNVFLKTTPEFFLWRFFTYPVNHYVTVITNGKISVGRLGTRGRLIELQILIYDIEVPIFILIKEFSKICCFDLISFTTSINNLVRSQLKKNLFLKVPNNINFCFKIIDKQLSLNMDNISLNSINFHTY